MISGSCDLSRTLSVVSRPVWVFVVAVAAALTACSRSAAPVTIGRAGSLPASTSTTPTTTVESPSTPVAFTVSSFDLQGPGTPDSVERAKAAVMKTLGRYLEDGVLAPLRSGGPAGDLVPLFTARAGEHLAASADRKAFIDEGLPPSPRIVAVTSGLRLSALAGPGGDVVLISARIDLKLVAGGQDATVTIDRGADLMLVADGDAWKIDSYSVRVTRDTPDTSATVVVGQ